jgi:ppGpp synthetase/RelA/SpoT-type nucleotidyltranferase
MIVRGSGFFDFYFGVLEVLVEGAKLETWLKEVLPKHGLLSLSVVSMVESLLKSKGIEFLAVTSRVKEVSSAVEKVKRKGYKDPEAQLTDLSGIRIIVFFESDIARVSELIRDAFEVDDKNSSDKYMSLSVNQIGYRSAHFVCDLGKVRYKLPEYSGMKGLKFEFQVRTVLQHAWAELAHDRNYKFSGKLPKEAERKLFLYAGMLEMIDRGFDELSNEIDFYIKDVQVKVEANNLDIDIDSISLRGFVESWAEGASFTLKALSGSKDDLSDLVLELSQFGVVKISQLEEIIPANFSSRARAIGYAATIYGVVRDWMLIHDWRKFKKDVVVNWIMSNEDMILEYLTGVDVSEFKQAFPTHYEGFLD